MKKYLLFGLIILVLVSCETKFSKIQKSKDGEAKLKAADTYFSKKNFEKAQILYEECFPNLKGTARYEEYYFKFAMSYYLGKDYLNAENILKNFLSIFPESNLSEEAEYIRAICFYNQSPKPELDQTETQRALSLLQSFLYAHPSSTKADTVQNYIDLLKAKLEQKQILSAFVYFNLSLYKSAAIAFTTINEEYPDSKKSDYTKYYIILSNYEYARKSINDKQEERLKKTIEECYDFEQRYGESPYLKEVLAIKNKSQNYKIKKHE